MEPMTTRHTYRTRRASTIRTWIPDQPGAWAMVLSPALSGLIVGGANIDSVWLFVAWTLCYCVQFTASRWLKSRMSRRYLKPMLGYLTALAIVGLPFVITRPGIMRWAPIYMVLAALSLLAAWTRRERSLWGNGVAVAASSLMAAVETSFGTRNIAGAACAVINGSLNRFLGDGSSTVVAAAGRCETSINAGMDAVRSLPVPGDWWNAYSLPIVGVLLAALFAVVQFGSVLFVKTMIRERGKRSYVTASWIWHGVMLLGAGGTAGVSVSRGWDRLDAASVLLVVLVVWLLARAVVLPILGRFRPLKPLIAGVTEMMSTVLTFALSLTLGLPLTM